MVKHRGENPVLCSQRKGGRQQQFPETSERYPLLSSGDIRQPRTSHLYIARRLHILPAMS